jgi:serine phosphatase RsbU (regulator of sigma subunit)
MAPRRRLIVSLVLTAVAFVAVGVYTAVRSRYWHHQGWSGMYYNPVQERDARAPEKRKRLPRSILPGQVVFTYPGYPAHDAGINSFDQVVAINGIPVSDRARLDAIDKTLHTGDAVTYRLRRNGVERDVTLRLKSPVGGVRSVVGLVISLGLAVCFLAIGVLVLVRRPEDRQAFVFFCMSTVGALYFESSRLIQLDGQNMRGTTGRFESLVMVIGCFFVLSVAFVALLLHLALVFPKDRPVLTKWPAALRWLYAAPGFFVATIVVWLAGAVALGTPTEQAMESLLSSHLEWTAGAVALIGFLLAIRIAWFGRVEGYKKAFLRRPVQAMSVGFALSSMIALILMLFKQESLAKFAFSAGMFVPAMILLVYPVFAFIALYRSYREAGVEEKRQVRWPLWGTMIAIGAQIVFGALSFLVGVLMPITQGDLGEWLPWLQLLEIIPRLLYVLIPISFAVAILKYRLMNIDVIIKKTVAYAILSGLIIVLYLALVGGLGAVLVNVAGVTNQRMVIISTLIVAIVFVPLRNQLQRMVDKNLFRQKTDYPQALRAISTDTLKATDTFSFLFLTAETVQQALQNRSIVIFTRRGEQMVATAKVGVADTLLGSLHFPAEAAALIDRPLDPKRRALPESAASALQRVDAALIVPVRSQGVVHGVIALGSKLSDREFDLEDIEFLSSVADQVAIAIDRIRLQREEVDFEQARQMQQALLPAVLPRVAGLDVSGTWEPARTVGGDYYDLLQLGPAQLGVCIGDVAGKGMPAALLMSALQAAVRASAAENVSPRELCERVRRVIVPSLGSRFVTLFFCTIDTQHRRIRFCNAGHNPPILARADGSVVRLAAGGPVLSRAFTSQPYQEGEHPIATGDRLLLFTDGVSEARDAREEDFGEERLERIVAARRQLGARELIAQIVSEVSAFSGGRTDDDLTLVAVGVSA